MRRSSRPSAGAGAAPTRLARRENQPSTAARPGASLRREGGVRQCPGTGRPAAPAEWQPAVQLRPRGFGRRRPPGRHVEPAVRRLLANMRSLHRHRARMQGRSGCRHRAACGGREPWLAASTPRDPPPRRRHMARSLAQAPHVTTLFEADLTRVQAHRARHASEFERRGSADVDRLFFRRVRPRIARPPGGERDLPRRCARVAPRRQHRRGHGTRQ